MSSEVKPSLLSKCTLDHDWYSIKTWFKANYKNPFAWSLCNVEYCNFEHQSFQENIFDVQSVIPLKLYMYAGSSSVTSCSTFKGLISLPSLDCSCDVFQCNIKTSKSIQQNVPCCFLLYVATSAFQPNHCVLCQLL